MPPGRAQTTDVSPVSRGCAIRHGGALPRDLPARRPLCPPTTRAHLALLESIEARLERLEHRLAILDDVPDVVATGVNIVDSNLARLQREGVDIDARLGELLPLVERLTRPETMQAMQAAVDIAESAPGMVGTFTDIADGVIERMQGSGIDLDERLRALVAAADLLSRPKVLDLLTFVDERGPLILSTVETLLDSGVFDPEPVMTISAAADALAGLNRSNLPSVGAWGLLTSLSDPNVARAVSFGREFARRFGDRLQACPKLPEPS